MTLALLVPLAGDALAVQCEGVDTTSNCATTCAGTALSDFLFGGSPANVMNGLDDDDEVHGEGGGDRVCGGPDTDSVRGNGSDDDVYGQRGADVIVAGGTQDDSVYGQEDGDKVYDGDGADFVDGGSGTDLWFICNDGAPDTAQNFELSQFGSCSP